MVDRHVNDLEEITIQGRAVSRGVAVGQVVCLYGNRRQFYRKEISENEIADEVARLNAALDAARTAIEFELDRLESDSQAMVAEILEIQSMILTDPSIAERSAAIVQQQSANAEWAIHKVFQEVSESILNNSDNHLREKKLDIDDVCDRVLAELGALRDMPSLGPNSIVAALELRPSVFLELTRGGCNGIVTETGGWTSHTSILARESKIPAVTGFSGLFETVHNGQIAVLDGFLGLLRLNPTKQTLKSLIEISRPLAEIPSHARDDEKPLTTIDGKEIMLRTNTVSSDAYRSAVQHGARGIGLFRSESLISKYGRIPNEDEQTAEFADLARLTGEYGLRIRTFDIDADQYEKVNVGRQKNPALGLRAIRLGMKFDELLRPQLRAVLRASSNPISIIVPMVSDVSEIEFVRKIIEEEGNDLLSAGFEMGKPPIGAMIEIPSAVVLADQLIECCDFLCLGTNDLAQYLLAADRDNESVSKWFRTLHPAMIRAVKSVVEVASKASKPLIVCGEMAGSPFYVPVLIGLGATELSMNPSSIAQVRRLIEGIAYEEAVQLVASIESLSTVDEIEDRVAEWSRSKWPHLFAAGFLEQRQTQ